MPLSLSWLLVLLLWLHYCNLVYQLYCLVVTPFFLLLACVKPCKTRQGSGVFVSGETLYHLRN
jgi:hypothetical protein